MSIAQYMIKKIKKLQAENEQLKKAWERLTEILNFSIKQGMEEKLYDYGYKKGLKKALKEMEQIKKDLSLT